MREHLAAVSRQTGEEIEGLDDDEPPEDTEYLWQWFCRLSGRRQSGMGPAPLAWPQIDAFFRLQGVVPDDWELVAIELLDNEWMAAASETQRSRSEKTAPPKKGRNR